MAKNSTYTWGFIKSAQKEFRHLDMPVQRRIIDWLDGHIYLSENPRQYGKALAGEFNTLWRYRIGKYRIVADIDDHQLLVLVVRVGKREKVYKD